MHDTMPEDGSDATARRRAAVRTVLERAWVDAGYTAPNTEVYPWMWLWDSCFHALVWSALGESDRALVEVSSALSTIDESGFVAHMGYQLDPGRHDDLWGRRGASSITQPPMYGHTLAELSRSGVQVPGSLLADATRGLRFLLDARPRVDGLVPVVHPWETGCDDSPRWDDLCPGVGFDLDRWRTTKNDLLATVARDPHGAPLTNEAFAVASVGFNALVAWNARELATVTDDDGLRSAADDLAEAVDARFDPDLRTWVDAGANAAGSGRARTADGLLPLLVSDDHRIRHRVVEELLDEDAHAGAYGPRGVHLGEPGYDPTGYWRGPVWPQLAYLLWRGLERAGDDGVADGADAAEVVRTTTIAGADASGFAEYWDPERGTGLGAVPQSWTGLVVVLADAGGSVRSMVGS